MYNNEYNKKKSILPCILCTIVEQLLTGLLQNLYKAIWHRELGNRKGDQGVAVSNMTKRAGEQQELRRKYLLSDEALGADAMVSIGSNSKASACAARATMAVSVVCECECGNGQSKLQGSASEIAATAAMAVSVGSRLEGSASGRARAAKGVC